MRVSREEKDRSYDRIVRAASEMLRERGLEATAVASVMNAAGMTHGGFYRHFDSKQALLGAALRAGFDERVERMGRRSAEVGASDAMDEFHADYLSRGHVENPALGCPAAALAGELRHAPEGLRATFGEGLEQVIEQLAAGARGPIKDRQRKALRRFSMLVGAVVLARACDPDTAETILAACRDQEAP